MNGVSNDKEGGESTRHSFTGRETVGEILLTSREEAGLTLEEVAQQTRIPQQMLNFLETDNFEAIPAKVYVKGFIRIYAGLLGLDVEHILSKYEVQTGQNHKSKGDLWEIETETIEESLEPQKIFKRFVIPAVLLVVVVIILLRIFGGGGVEIEPPSSIPDVGEETSIDEADRINMEDAGEAESAPEQVPEESDVSVEPGIAMELRMTARPSDTCWFDLIAISMVDSRPETTFYDFVIFPDQSAYFHANEAFVLRKVGNAGGFYMELNGRQLPSLGERGYVLNNIEITADDIQDER